MNVRSDERISEPIRHQPERSFHRYSYDIYDDQVEAIDALAYRWRKKQGRHITKGEVIRTLLDIALQTLK